MRYRSRFGIATLALLGVAHLIPVPARGQQPPEGRPFILKAADDLNAITPIGLPEQTILIGSVDGVTGTFTWALDGSYPANVPEYKKAENGGPVQPSHVASITSLNVVYEFTVTNPRQGLKIVLYLPDENGTMQERPATFQSGTWKIAFRPLTFGRQTVRITAGGKVTAIAVTPALAEQLGAFVVPHLLLNILYEPPGARSVATYEQTHTAGSSISWGFSRGTRVVETVDPEKLNNMFISAMSTAAGAASKAAGKAVEVVAGLREQHLVTTTTDSSAGSFGSQGTWFSLSKGFSTGIHQYPGQGDRFLIMYDALFVYFATRNKIFVAPVAFSAVRGLTAADMKNELPAAVVTEFLSLDPHFAAQTTGMLAGAAIAPGQIGTSKPPARPRPPDQPRFSFYEKLSCDTTGANWTRLVEGTTQTSGQSQTISKTIVDKVKGLGASLSGLSENVVMLTYTTSTAQTQSVSNSASVSAWCGSPEGAYEIMAYFDNVLRTFFTLKGEPLTGPSYIAGTVTNDLGQPQSGQKVTLRIGSARYSVVSGPGGAFSFNFSGMPSGTGRLVVARASVPITLAGTPLQGIRLVARRLTLPRPQ
jgi:hypothetical protein